MKLIDEVRSLVDSYSERLSQKGIACKVTKRYFETKVSSVYKVYRRGLLNLIDEYISRKKERKYADQPNTHHCIILKFYPIHGSESQKENCKVYSFIISQKWRAHIGEEPEQSHKDEKKILSKIEKRLNKITNKAACSTPEQTCKNSLFDIMRYLLSSKYGYMKRIAGKERITVEIFVMISIVLLVLLLAVIIGLIFKLI